MSSRDYDDKSEEELVAIKDKLRDALIKEENELEEVVKDYRNLCLKPQSSFPRLEDTKLLGNKYLRRNEVNAQVNHSGLLRIVAFTRDLSRIDFSVVLKSLLDESVKFTLTVTEPLEYELVLELDKAAEKIVNIERVTFNDPLVGLEMISSIKKCIQNNAMQQVTSRLCAYSELCTAREHVLIDLHALYESYFSYERSKESGHYVMMVRRDGLLLFNADWKMAWYRSEYLMGHSFKVNVFEGTVDMGKRQKDNFLRLTEPDSLLSQQEIMHLLKSIVLAFITDCDDYEEEQEIEAEEEQEPET